MKTLLFVLSLGVTVVAGPSLVRECYNRLIALSRTGVPLSEYAACPACERHTVTMEPGGASEQRYCHGCGHAWLPPTAPRLDSLPIDVRN